MSMSGVMSIDIVPLMSDPFRPLAGGLAFHSRPHVSGGAWMVESGKAAEGNETSRRSFIHLSRCELGASTL